MALINQFERTVIRMSNQRKSNFKKYSGIKRGNIKANTKTSETKKTSLKEQARFSDMNQIDWFPINPYCD